MDRVDSDATRVQVVQETRELQGQTRVTSVHVVGPVEQGRSPGSLGICVRSTVGRNGGRNTAFLSPQDVASRVVSRYVVSVFIHLQRFEPSLKTDCAILNSHGESREQHR